MEDKKDLLFDPEQQIQLDKFLNGDIKPDQKEFFKELKTLIKSNPLHINSNLMNTLINTFKDKEHSIQATHLIFDKFNKETEDCMKLFSKSSLSTLTIEDASKIENDFFTTVDSFTSLKEISLAKLPSCIQKEQLDYLTVLQKITTLKLIDCKELKKISEKLNEMEHIQLIGLKTLTSFDMGANKLREIEIRDCVNLNKINLKNKISLKKLTLSKLPKLDIDLHFDEILQIQEVNIEDCEKIKNIGNNSSSETNQHLTKLSVINLKELKSFYGFKGMPALTKLEINACSRIESLHGIQGLSKTLEKLTLIGVKKLIDLNYLYPLKKLKKLTIQDCSLLKSLQYLNKELPGLEKLSIGKNSSLTLNDLKDEFENLTYLEIKNIPVSNFYFLNSCKNLQDLTLVLKPKHQGVFPTLENLQKISLEGFDIDNIKTVILSLPQNIAMVTIESEIPNISVNKFYEFIEKNHDLLEKISSFKETDIKNDLLKQSVSTHKFYQKSINSRQEAILAQSMNATLEHPQDSGNDIPANTSHLNSFSNNNPLADSTKNQV